MKYYEGLLFLENSPQAFSQYFDLDNIAMFCTGCALPIKQLHYISISVRQSYRIYKWFLFQEYIIMLISTNSAELMLYLEKSAINESRFKEL